VLAVIVRRARRGRTQIRASRLKGAVGSATRLAITLKPINLK
jgi:hypothetical protein